MGFTPKRVGARGVSFAAVYRDASGTIRRAGSYLTKKEADKAWQHAETRQAEGRITVLRLAGLPEEIRMHDLRHAHASWLLAGGADLQVVKERFGHQSIATTEKYLHTLPGVDETALAALDRVRTPGRRAR